MVFSDAAGGAGIVEDIDFLLNTTVANYPLAQKTRNINRRYDETVALILQSDSRWEWDDSNQTDLPIATSNLVDSQQDYQIAGGTFLKILRVEVKDSAGNFFLLYPISEHDVQSQALSEFQKTPGRPIYYDKQGDSIFLYPKPSSNLTTLTGGLKIYYQRGPSYFAVSDTTKAPGFSPLFHRILSLGAALDYCLANTILLKSEFLTPLLQKMQADLMTFYSQRSRDESVRARLRQENYGSEDGYSPGMPRVSDRVAYY